jgi:para-nitrobenzyl esterase
VAHSVEFMRAVRWSVMLAAVLTTTGFLTSEAGAQASMDARRLPDPAVVVTYSGALRGTVAAAHRTFSGIPYAAPPVRDRRRRGPLPPRPWPSTRDPARQSLPADGRRSAMRTACS